MKNEHLLVLFFLALLCCLYFYNNTEPFRLSTLDEKNNAGLNTCKGGLYCLDGELCDNYPDLYKRHFPGEKYYLRKNIIKSENDNPANYKIIAKQCVGPDNRLKDCDEGETPKFIFHKNDSIMEDQYDAEYIKSPGNCTQDTHYPNILSANPNYKIKLKPNNVCIEKQLIPKEDDNGETHYFGKLCNSHTETQNADNMYLTPSSAPNEFCGKYTMNNYDPMGGSSLYDLAMPISGNEVTADHFVYSIGDYQKSVPNMCDLSSTDDYKRQTSNYTLRTVADPIRNESVFKNNKYFTSLCNLREDLFISADNISDELAQPGPWSKCIIFNRQYVEETPENFDAMGYSLTDLSCEEDEIIIISVHPNSIVTKPTTTNFKMVIESNDPVYDESTYFVYNNSAVNFTTILPFIHDTLDIDDPNNPDNPDNPNTLNGLTLEQHISDLASEHNGNGGFSGTIVFVVDFDLDGRGNKIFDDFNLLVNIKKIKISSLTDTETNIGDNSLKIEYFISLINMVTDTYTKFIKNIIGKENFKNNLVSAGHPGSDDIDVEIENVILSLFTITQGNSDDTTVTVHPENLNSLIDMLVPNLSPNPELQWHIRDYHTTNENSALTQSAKTARKNEILREIIKIIIDHILKNSCRVITHLSNIKSRFEKLLTDEGDLSTIIDPIDTKLMSYLRRLLASQTRLVQFNRTLEEMITSSVHEPNTVNAVDYIYNIVNSSQQPSLSNTPSLVCSSNVWLQELKEKLDDIGNSITSPGDSGDLETAKTDAKKSYIRDIINSGRHFTGEYSGECDFSGDGIISDSRQPVLQNCILDNIKRNMRSECYGKLLPLTGEKCHSNSTWQECRTSIEGLSDEVKSTLGYCDLTGTNNLWADESSQCNNRNYGPWNYLTAG